MGEVALFYHFFMQIAIGKLKFGVSHLIFIEKFAKVGSVDVRRQPLFPGGALVLEQPKSLASQVERILRRRLREGVYSAGERMPSESALAAEFGVSRATVRTVLAKLAAHGLVLRRQGDGTYVNARLHQSHAHFGNLWDFSCLIESSGFEPSIRLVTRSVRPATPEEARALALSEGAVLLSVQRLFFADRRAVILARNVFPLEIFRISPEKVDWTLPIRELLREAAGNEIAFAVTEVHAVPLPKPAAEHLAREVDSPVLRLDVSFFGRNNAPLALGQSYFDDETLHLSLVQAW